MKILVTGSNGQLGEALIRRLPDIDPVATLVPATRNDFDITKRNSTIKFIAESKPDVLVNCAAFTDVAGAQKRQELAYSVNVNGAGYIAEACALASIRLIHISSDYVFDGKKSSPYVENDIPSPAGVYAVSKADGEKKVMEIFPDALIIRASWLFGHGGKNFITKIMDKARKIKKLSVVDDQIGSPSFADDLAEAIYRLIHVDAKGFVHVANKGYCSRFELASEAIRLAGPNDVTVEPVSLDDYETPAPQPRNTSLDTSLYEKITGHKLRRWEKALAEYISTNKRFGKQVT